MRDDAAMDEDEERNVGDEVQEVHHASHLPVELGQNLQYTCTLHQQVHSNFATAYSTRALYVSNNIKTSPLPAVHVHSTSAIPFKLRNCRQYTCSFHSHTKHKLRTRTLSVEHKLRHYQWYTYTFHGNIKVKTSPLPVEYVHFP